jgi:hypothetical protein
MEMPAMQSDLVAPVKSRRGRIPGSKNREGHHAGRPLGSRDKHPRKPRKPLETFDEALWQNGRRRISVGDTHIAESLQRSSSACAIAEALKEQIPNAVHVSIDLATIRWTDRVKQLRYLALTPVCAQELICSFDQGEREKLQPISFDLRPVMIARSGQRRRQVPDGGELRGSGISPPARKLVAYAGKETARERRELSKMKPDGTIPVVLGGRMPPISALPGNRRAFGLRQARR